jgi:LacI family transcriptional regulator
MGVTIKEVARKARVSTATVSRVINNSGSVDEGTRRIVVEAARELKYLPHAVGRSLSTRRTDAIGLLLPDLHGEFFSEVIRGADQSAQNNKLHLLVSSSHNNQEDIKAALQMMRGRVDGLIIMSPHISAQALEENISQSLPLVLLNCDVDGELFDSLTIDNFNGAFQVVKHLFSHGHKRIAIIKGTERNFDSLERLRGYRTCIEQEGAERDLHLEISGNFSEASGYDGVRKALRLHPRPTAIFASNDSTAIGALSALREEGVKIPAEMAIAGFDDIPVARYLSPSLTSVHFGIDDLGARAVETLLHGVRENNRHQKRRITLPTTLSIRESCGCTQ